MLRTMERHLRQKSLLLALATLTDSPNDFQIDSLVNIHFDSEIDFHFDSAVIFPFDQFSNRFQNGSTENLFSNFQII